MYVLKYLNYDLRETWRFVDEKCTVIINKLQITDLYLYLGHKDLRKHFERMKAGIKKFI